MLCSNKRIPYGVSTLCYLLPIAIDENPVKTLFEF